MDEEEAIPLRTFTGHPNDKAEDHPCSNFPVIESSLKRMDDIDLNAGSFPLILHLTIQSITAHPKTMSLKTLHSS